MNCMYYAAKKGGEQCLMRATHDVRFCASHRRCYGQSLLFMNISLFLNDHTSLRADNIYECFDNLWKTYGNISDRRFDVAFVGVEIVSYLLDHRAIEAIGKRLRIPLRPYKSAAAFDIVYIMWNIWHLGRRDRFMTALVLAQRKWRARKQQILARLQGPWPAVPAINNTDPFTMDSLTDLPLRNVFSFVERHDGRNDIYAFSGLEFFTYVYFHGNTTNPLTRAAIDHDTINRLYTWATMNNCSRPPEPVVETPTTVITYAVSELERLHNICIQPDWLLQLDEMQIMGIFSQYHQNLLAYGPNVPFMNRQAEEDSFEADNPGPSQMALGREMITMIHTEQPPSFYICNLVLVLATYSDLLNASLPEWVRDAAEM